MIILFLFVQEKEGVKLFKKIEVSKKKKKKKSSTILARRKDEGKRMEYI